MSEYASKQSENHAAPAVATAPGASVGKRTLVEAAYEPAGPDMQRPADAGGPAVHAEVASAATAPATSVPQGDRVQRLFGRPDASSADRTGHWIQRRAAGPVMTDPNGAVARTTDSTGAPLPADLRTRFATSLGSDLSSVRVHTGAVSATAAEGLGARAFAVGHDIHFAAGQYRPDELSGVHLLAHEVAHTVQQAGGANAARLHKLEVSTPGDAAEVEADRAAAAMMAGAPATIGGTEPQIARATARSATPVADKPATSPVWVEFDTNGNWTAAQVLATLANQVAVPDDLKAAIQAGPKATASYCVALRDRVGADEPDAAKKEQISNALTSRVTELVYATPQSPLQYSQLAEVARWADRYKAAGPATPAAGAAGATADNPAQGAAAGKGDEAAAAYATHLASQPGGRVRKGDKDETRTADFQANDGHQGEESGNAELTGWTFLRDPFDNTVTATRPASTATADNAGLQFTFQVEKGDGGATKTTLVRTIVLSKLRVGALKRQDRMAPTEMQETEAQKNARLANDAAMNERDRKYDTEYKVWVGGGKQGSEPEKPKGYLSEPHRNTLCVRTPVDVYGAAGGTARGGFNFDPRLQQNATPWAWRTLDSNPDGPKAGDVYYLWDVAKNRAAHMGVFKSTTPVAGSEDLYTWVVTDGGQGGGYEQIQQAQERTRGPFNKKTGLFLSSIADAGQAKGDRRLVGWVDIDAYDKGKPDAQGPVST